MAKYSTVWVYTKRTNLSAYLTCVKLMELASNQQQADAWRKYYAKEKEVQLIALLRWEKGKCFCKIKCPINPLPVKGEFEVPSTTALADFLKANGWCFKDKLYPRMFE